MACGQPSSDIYADHEIYCGSQGERISHHNHLRDAVYQAAVSASLGPSREDRALLPGVEARPADVYVPLWAEGGRDMALDIAVVNPFQQLTIERAARVRPPNEETTEVVQVWRGLQAGRNHLSAHGG